MGERCSHVIIHKVFCHFFPQTINLSMQCSLQTPVLSVPALLPHSVHLSSASPTDWWYTSHTRSLNFSSGHFLCKFSIIHSISMSNAPISIMLCLLNHSTLDTCCSLFHEWNLPQNYDDKF